MFAGNIIIFLLLPTCLLASFCRKSGFDRDNNYYEYEECCSGYIETYKNDKRECEPICSTGCTNGMCRAPDDCKCNEGFTNIDHFANSCTPVCSKGCINGKCIAPEICQCPNDFQLDESAGSCVPICINNCPNGRCVSPEYCSCNEGYWKAQNQSCFPSCGKDCPENSFCAAPNHCSCLAGFVEENNLCVTPENKHSIASSSSIYVDNLWLVIQINCVICFMQQAF